MLSIHCRCVTNILKISMKKFYPENNTLKISMKKFDPENNMIDLQGFEHSYIPATPHCGGYTESLACSQFLVHYSVILANIQDVLQKAKAHYIAFKYAALYFR